MFEKEAHDTGVGRAQLRGSMLRVLPAVIAVGATIWWISGEGVLAVVRGCRIGPLVLGMTLQVGAGLVLGLRWRTVLQSVGASPIPTRRTATILSLRAQAAVALAPGGIGADIVRGFEAGYGREMLGRLTKVAILERLAGAGVLTAIGLTSVLQLLSPRWGRTVAVALIVFPVAVVLLPDSWTVAGRSLRIRRVLGWTVINQLLALGGLAAGLAATGVHARAGALIAIAVVAAFAAMLPVSFNGYGVRELALAVLAPALGLDGKALAASGLVASTILLAGLMIAALGARMIPTGEKEAART